MAEGTLARAKWAALDLFGRKSRQKARALGKENESLVRICNDLFYVAVPALLDRNPRATRLAADSTGRACYCGGYKVVENALPKVSFTETVDESADYYFLWGYKASKPNVALAAAAARGGATLVTCEDGFLRSADTWANYAAPDRYRHGCSVIFDTIGFYYDATRPSGIENMLNDPGFSISEEQAREAKRLIDRIVSAKLTKYNHQPIFTPDVGRRGRRKVLVVDQSYGDFAIKKGWGSDQTFADMLEDAKAQNPDADILVKTHPDTMTGKRAGYYDGVREEGNVFRVTMPVNPYSLMEIVDKVYVCSTQLGFEALMAGKEVHVYGMPFYAGWGLTEDMQKNPRRTRRRSLEEVFHAFYLLYTRWTDVDSGALCSIDKAIDNLISLREEYAALRRGNG